MGNVTPLLLTLLYYWLGYFVTSSGTLWCQRGWGAIATLAPMGGWTHTCD